MYRQIFPWATSSIETSLKYLRWNQQLMNGKESYSAMGYFNRSDIQAEFMTYCMERKSPFIFIFIGLLLCIWAISESIYILIHSDLISEIIFQILSLFFLIIALISGYQLFHYSIDDRIRKDKHHQIIQAIFILSMNFLFFIKIVNYSINSAFFYNTECYFENGTNMDAPANYYSNNNDHNITNSADTFILVSPLMASELSRVGLQCESPSIGEQFTSPETGIRMALTSLLLMPVLYEPRFYLVIFCTVTIGSATIYLDSSQVSDVLSFLMILLAFLLLCYELQQRRILAFLNHRHLLEMLDEKEKNAEMTQATEMRHMIGNVAHDLKTPLSSFTNGIDLILSHIDNLQEKAINNAITPAVLSETCEAVHSTLMSIRNTNAFMLMAINRCVDYTKATKGLKLNPKNETINFLETMRFPVEIMRNIQDKIPIQLFPIPKEICSHIITDKQWLQENILCLLSNAVKYSTEGTVTISVNVKELNELLPLIDPSLLTENDHSSSSSFFDTYHPHNNNSSNSTTNLYAKRKTSTSSNPSQKSFYSSFLRRKILEIEMKEDEELPDKQYFLYFEIEDHGIGIAEDQVSKLFSPFKQAQRLTGGTGLGLFSLAKRMEALKGLYGVMKRHDQSRGSLFWFAIPYRPDNSFQRLESMNRQYLWDSKGTNNSESSPHGLANIAPSPPYSSPRPPSSSQEEAASSAQPLSEPLACPLMSCPMSKVLHSPSEIIVEHPPPSASNERKKSPLDSPEGRPPLLPQILQPVHILLVDDAPSILKMCSMMLRKQGGYDVTTAENGEIALERIEEKWKNTGTGFDVILMDLQMPVMDGLEATKRLRELERKDAINKEWLHRKISDDSLHELEISFHPAPSPSSKIIGVPLPTSASSSPLSISSPNRTKKYHQHHHPPPPHGIHQIIFGVSANSDHETMKEAFDAGIDEFLAKPFSVDVFRTTWLKVQQKQQQQQQQHSFQKGNGNKSTSNN